MPTPSFVTTRMKLDFFDSKKVTRALDKNRRRALARGGAFVRTTARRSMRRKKGPSSPGQPPHAHEGSLRKLIFFGYDRDTKSVVVGPLPIKRSPVPSVLEFGGTIETKRVRRVNGKKKTERGRVRIAPRPSMRPALDTAVASGRVPQAFKDSIRSG